MSKPHCPKKQPVTQWWTCRDCGSMNHPFEDRCHDCGARKPCSYNDRKRRA